MTKYRGFLPWALMCVLIVIGGISLIVACDTPEGRMEFKRDTLEEMGRLGLHKIREPVGPAYENGTKWVFYVKDDLKNCYMIIHNYNGHGSIMSPTNIPCPEEKP